MTTKSTKSRWTRAQIDDLRDLALAHPSASVEELMARGEGLGCIAGRTARAIDAKLRRMGLARALPRPARAAAKTTLAALPSVAEGSLPALLRERVAARAHLAEVEERLERVAQELRALLAQVEDEPPFAAGLPSTSGRHQ